MPSKYKNKSLNSGFHKVNAGEACRTHNPKAGMWNSRSKPYPISHAENILS